MYMLEKSPKERSEEFITEYKGLVDKHKIDVAHYPTFVPLGNGVFGISIQSSPVDLLAINQSKDVQENKEDDTKNDTAEADGSDSGDRTTV